ncbi:uncharacterized protein [Lolium perenne]|uniref:uncharacterized protein isoform X1 n=1 Tax=Lolium perenne TaxID=4522 RepID=UPI0021F561E7|nr:uncharacterized protein LOC127313084 isoform X2 [Lolium perenne]
MSYHGAHKQCRLPSPACHGIDHEPCRLGQGRWCARHALDDLDAAVSWSSSLLPQSVTKNLSLGAEAFCLAQQRNSDISHACTCASGFETPTEDWQYLLQCCFSRKGRPNDAQVGHTGMLSVLSRKVWVAEIMVKKKHQIVNFTNLYINNVYMQHISSMYRLM